MRWSRSAGGAVMKAAITGATGFIGRHIAQKLQASDIHVIALSRNVERAKAVLPGVEVVHADLEHPGPWFDRLDGVDAVINLAGEPIAAARWNARRKQLLRDSRVETTRTLVEAIATCAKPPRVLVSASGVDYYPFAIELDDFADDEVTESDPSGDHFLARLCKSWETEALQATSTGARVCTMRTGLVLGDGGALPKMVTLFKRFLGGRLGSGRQWMSWIHLDDVVAAYAAALSDSRYTGPINLVAGSVRNADFAAALGKALHRPSSIPTPAFALRAVLGEFADVLIHGRRVVPRKLQALGFSCTYARLDQALRSSSA